MVEMLSQMQQNLDNKVNNQQLNLMTLSHQQQDAPESPDCTTDMVWIMTLQYENDGITNDCNNSAISKLKMDWFNDDPGWAPKM